MVVCALLVISPPPWSGVLCWCWACRRPWTRRDGAGPAAMVEPDFLVCCPPLWLGVLNLCLALLLGFLRPFVDFLLLLAVACPPLPRFFCSVGVAALLLLCACPLWLSSAPACCSLLGFAAQTPSPPVCVRKRCRPAAPFPLFSRCLLCCAPVGCFVGGCHRLLLHPPSPLCVCGAFWCLVSPHCAALLGVLRCHGAACCVFLVVLSPAVWCCAVSYSLLRVLCGAAL